MLFFNERAVGVTLPNFIEQAIVETEPGFSGDTATGRDQAREDLRPARTINVPLFIRVGDIVKIDTRTGEYLERVGRAPSRGPRGRAARASTGRRARSGGAGAHRARASRAWFEAEGFLEVETPARVRAPGQEIHLDAIPRRRRRGRRAGS